MENHGSEVGNDEIVSIDNATLAIGNAGGSVGNATNLIMPASLTPPIAAPYLTFSDSTNMGTTNVKPPNIFQRMYMRATRSINESNYKYKFVTHKVTSYEDKYWSVVRVNEEGHVWYKVFRGWWGGRFLYRCGILRGYSLYWESIPKREKLEATLGAAYLGVDQTITDDKKRRKQIKFIQETCKTDPDNLKMISELDKLDKGVGVEDGPTGDMYAQQFTVSGSGTFSGP